MSAPDSPQGPPRPEPGPLIPRRPPPADDQPTASLDLGTLPAARASRAHGDGRPASAPPPGAARAEGAPPAADRDAGETLEAGPPPEAGPRQDPAPGPTGGATSGSSFLSGVSLQAKLLSLLLIAMIAALTVTGYGVQAVLRGYLVDQIDRQLGDITTHAQHDTNFLESLTNGGAQRFRSAERFPSSYRVQVCADADPTSCEVQGGYMLDSEGGGISFPAVSNDQATAREGTAYTLTADDGTTWRAFSFPYPVYSLAGERYPGSITIAQSLAGVNNAVTKLRLLSVIFGSCVMVLGLVFGWLAVRRAFVPLVEVEDTAAAIAAGDLSRRVPERPPSTEVGRLTSSLNGMLNQIERAFRAREASEARTRRFAADASHELRTPLAAIRGFAELYRQGAVPAGEVGHTMRRIENEATRMGGLVEDLLLLARLDEQRPGRTGPVDLAVLAGDAVHDARALDPTRRVGLLGLGAAGGPSPAVVTGDEDRLRQVVANLMANAVRHTPSGTPIEVAVGVLPPRPQTPPAAVLEVRDHGPGLTPDQAQRVFERFYRVDSSRTRTQGGGSGLGLSIVAAVIAAHGGRVQTLPTPGGGATFRVEIPADGNGQVTAGADARTRTRA